MPRPAGANLATVCVVAFSAFGDFRWSKPDHDHHVGPALAYGQGRFWLSGAMGFGLSDQSGARYGRLVLGLVF